MADDPLDAAIADRLARAARAAQDLCDVLWEVLHGELSDRARSGPRAQRVVDLSGRVADISSTVAMLARDAAPDEALHEPSITGESSRSPVPAVAPEPSAAPRSADMPLPEVMPAPPAMPGTPAMPVTSVPRSEAVIVDERAEESEQLSAVERPVGDPRIWPPIARDQTTPTVGESPPRGRPLPWDEPPREEMRVTRRAVDRPPADKPV